MAEGDLFKVLGEVPMTDCFGSEGRYHNWEERIAQPRLEELGYRVVRWHTIDGDSLGPLVRGVDVVKDDVMQTLAYG